MITEITINEVITDINLNVTEIIDTVIITINDIAIGVASGGTTGQVLAKASNIDFDTEWVNQSGGGGGAVDSVNGQTGVVELGLQEITDENNVTNNPLRVQVGSEYSEIKEDGINLHNSLTNAIHKITNTAASADANFTTPNKAGSFILATTDDITGAKSDDITNESTVTGATVTDALNTLDTDKAPLASPTFTGTPTAPSPAPGDYSDKLATTSFVGYADSLKANIASPTFAGTVTTPAIVVSSETASRIASFDASKNVKSLDTATYPSLSELAYVKGATSNLQSQINSSIRALVKKTTPSSAVTGTTAETLVETILIPANSVADGDFLRLSTFAQKTGTAGTSIVKLRIYPTNNFASSILIATGATNAATTIGTGLIQRTLNLSGGNVESFRSVTVGNSDFTLSQGVRTLFPIDFTQDWYIFISITLGNSADSMLTNFYLLEKF